MERKVIEFLVSNDCDCGREFPEELKKFFSKKMKRGKFVYTFIEGIESQASITVELDNTISSARIMASFLEKNKKQK